MTTFNRDTIGTRIRALRQDRVITQLELSSMSGVPLPTLKDIERGRTLNPRVKTIRRLATALEVQAIVLVQPNVG